MSTDVSAEVIRLTDEEPTPQVEEHFAERRRIILMEPDASLRSVLVRTLLQLGCIISFKYTLEQVCASLQNDLVDGAVVALDDNLDAVCLQKANRHQTSIVVLSYMAADPHLIQRLPTVHFVRKPFDIRDLLRPLQLPEKAKIVTAK